MFPDKNMISWRSAVGEHFSSGNDGEISVILAYNECRFRLLLHSFISKVLEYYGVELVNLAPNSTANLIIFIYLCEAYLGISPDLKVFKYFYMMAKSGKSTVSAGECSLRLHDGKVEEYICMYPKSLWSSRKKSWFYMTVTKGDSF